ncbi:MAG: hypothetical protein ACLFWG_04415 [Longimicrobiales bacterium]
MWRLILFLPLAVATPSADLSRAPMGEFRVQASSPPPDSARLHERARRLQDRFETLRRRALPRTSRGNPWRECDEIVGRFCLYFGGDSDWEPVPDSPEVLQARGDLLDSLTHIAGEIPGDGWVVGQLVQYLGEEGRWGEAREWVDGCDAWEGSSADVVSAFARARPGWWCHALHGFVLHRSDRYPEALAAFERALERMHPDRRERWLDPDVLLDGEADDVWDDAEPGERSALRDRLWALSDPLHLVQGNDRLTEHYARHTVSWIREDAENPYGMSWGWDLEELVVRYGAEMGWNRTTTPAGSLRPANIVGHHHPESRHFLPPGPALSDPFGFEGPGWVADADPEGGSGADEAATAYAPPYAPDLRFEPFQIARFRRGEEMIVVAGYRVPPDTTRPDPPEGGAEAIGSDDGDESGDGAREDADLPRVDGVGPRDLDFRDASRVRAGLFLFRADGGLAGSPAYERRRGGAGPGDDPTREREASSSSGALHLRVPMGRYLVSVEAWDSTAARAGRFRRGIGLEPLPPDVAAISDLVILEAQASRGSSAEDRSPGRTADPTADSTPDSTSDSTSDSTPDSTPGASSGPADLPRDLESALPLVRPLAELCPGEDVAVGWELTGIGFRREAVEMGLRLGKTDRGFFSRVGDFLGLTSPPEPLTLEWTEQGPGEPRPFFRSVRLSLPPEMEAGAYLLVLEARLPGRNPLETVRRVRVPEDGGCEGE